MTHILRLYPAGATTVLMVSAAFTSSSREPACLVSVTAGRLPKFMYVSCSKVASRSKMACIQNPGDGSGQYVDAGGLRLKDRTMSTASPASVPEARQLLKLGIGRLQHVVEEGVELPYAADALKVRASFVSHVALLMPDDSLLPVDCRPVYAGERAMDFLDEQELLLASLQRMNDLLAQHAPAAVWQDSCNQKSSGLPWRRPADDSLSKPVEAYFVRWNMITAEHAALKSKAGVEFGVYAEALNERLPPSAALDAATGGMRAWYRGVLGETQRAIDKAYATKMRRYNSHT